MHLVALALLIACAPDPQPAAPEAEAVVEPEPSTPRVGSWRAWLDSPGGELPVGLDLSEGGGRWQAWLLNGPERIPVDEVRVEGDAMVLDIAHYDAQVTLGWDALGQTLDGEWTKTRSGGEIERLPFHATWRRARRFSPLLVVGGPGRITGRWAVHFASEPEAAVAIFEQEPDGTEVTGTFLTSTGDYRSLQGSIESGTLRLSTFDGAHAFLFQATLTDGALAGDFWSGAGWHDTWTATRDADAALPDPLALTHAADTVDWSALSFPDLDGQLRSLDDSDWSAGPRLVQIMGTWCPNCNDQTELLVELHRRYAAQGLGFVSLAFEHGTPERDAAMVRRYQDHHGTPWTYLLAGSSDKAAAGAALPILDAVRAYPTLLFVDRDGRVRATYTGFTGPAAPTEHLILRTRYEQLIDTLLAGS